MVINELCNKIIDRESDQPCHMIQSYRTSDGEKNLLDVINEFFFFPLFWQWTLVWRQCSVHKMIFFNDAEILNYTDLHIVTELYTTIKYI